MTRRAGPPPDPRYQTYAEVYDAYHVTHHERKLLRQCLSSVDYYRRKARSLPVHGPAPPTPWERIDRWGAGKPESEWLRIAQAVIECRRILEHRNPELRPRQVA